MGQVAQAITIKDRLCNLLLLPISSSTGLDQTKTKAEEISQKIDPKSKVTVKNLNALGRLLVGYKNTISIPFINYVLVNEQWLATLTPKAEEFVLARSMMYLLDNPYEYAVFKYLCPLFVYGLGRLLNDYINDYGADIFPGKKQLTHCLSEALAYLLPSYFLRKIEYKLDALAAIQFDCFDGAIAALSDSTKFSHDGSILDKFNSKTSGIEAADLAATISGFYTDTNLLTGPYSKIAQLIFTSIKIDLVSFPLKLLLSPKYLIPGRFSDRQSTLFNFFKNLPLVNLIFDYPKSSKRIRELNELRKKILKDKINGEKENTINWRVLI